MKRKIFVTGDCHGDIKRFSSNNWPEGKELTKEDVVIQLGDFAVIWNNEQKTNEAYWMEWLVYKPWTTVVILGNHEGYDRLMELPEGEIFGAKCWEWKIKGGSVYFIKAGEIMTINNETFLCVRGGLSIDKAYRQEGRSWWPQEMLTAEEETNTLNNLDAINWEVDWMLTHTTADSVISGFLDNPNSPKFNDPVSRFLEFVANKLDFRANLFGHFHNERTFIDGAKDYYRCFHHSIVDLDSIKKDIENDFKKLKDNKPK